MKNALILAAGRSTRFGRNKLEEKFDGMSLPYLAALFALDNGAENIYLTLSRSAVKTDGARIYHPVLDEVSKICDPIVRFQSEDTYGPGAAITTWAGVIEGPFTVLFGDNFYKGLMPERVQSQLGSESEGAVWYTHLYKPLNPRNLQLAAVIKNYVVEKPHGQLEGHYFCGFARFPAGYLETTGDLRKSDRGEIEITDMINMAKKREAICLRSVGVTWGDLTYEADCARIRELVREGK
jgi:dTDP-glucose pyrophosphorylase